MRKYSDIKIRTRISFEITEKFFGVGVSKLLHLIEKDGSIRKASEEMNMSYTKALKILKRVEKEMDIKLLDTVVGGVGGGLSKLTEEAKELLTIYDNMVEEVEKEVERISKKYLK